MGADLVLHDLEHLLHFQDFFLVRENLYFRPNKRANKEEV